MLTTSITHVKNHCCYFHVKWPLAFLFEKFLHLNMETKSIWVALDLWGMTKKCVLDGEPSLEELSHKRTKAIDLYIILPIANRLTKITMDTILIFKPISSEKGDILSLMSNSSRWLVKYREQTFEPIWISCSVNDMRLNQTSVPTISKYIGLMNF